MAEAQSAPMKLRLLSPTGVAAEVPCDSAQLFLRDNAQGRGGGMMGIKRGHIPAVMALGQGPVRASLGGTVVFSARVDGGFASVRDNEIIVITDSAVVDGAEPPAESAE